MYLANPTLQKIIKQIDSSPQKFEQLEQEIENDPDFERFMILLMQTLGYFDEQARFIDPLG